MTSGIHRRGDPDDIQASEVDGSYRGPLIRFFLRRVRNRAEAEDLTQQAFLRLTRAKQRGEVQNTEAFLFTVASNLFRDHRRSLRRRGDETVSIDGDLVGALANEIVEDRSPERVLIGRETVVDILRALDELGERTRDIFVLFKLENMKQRDIAALFGISQSTVEKHVARAVLHLATRYGSV